MRDVADMMAENDLFIMFSIRASLNIYDPFIKELSMNKCNMSLVTMSKTSPYHKYFDQIFNLPCISKASALQFLDDQAIFFVFIEILLRELAKSRE